MFYYKVEYCLNPVVNAIGKSHPIENRVIGTLRQLYLQVLLNDLIEDSFEASNGGYIFIVPVHQARDSQVP